MDDDSSFLRTLIGDGRPLLVVTALALLAAGGFALFQAATGHFLPHDVAWLGMTAEDLCALNACRIVHFMIHDRVSFGGVLIAIAVMYLWLILFPLRLEAWAWWALALSGAAGFLSFLGYLGYGYLDTWHAVATLVLLPLFGSGLVFTRRIPNRVAIERPRFDLRSRPGRGRALLLLSTLGIVVAGLTILGVGITRVFVPQDLQFIGLSRLELEAVNPNLVPLIAHDRAGFGGALISAGLAMFLTVLHARPSRSLWQALAIAGSAGFIPAIGVHPAIGYTDFSHLGPAVLGGLVFAVGLATSWPSRGGAARGGTTGRAM